MTLNIPHTDGKRVVIVGGGFGGLQLVKKLARSGYQVVLVDRNNYHMFQPLLYQVATAAINPGDISFPFRKLFRGKKEVYFRMAEVRRIDPDRNKIYTDRGELGYDYLVLASGSTTNFFGMRNIEEQSYAMKEVGEALAIRNRVLLHIEKAVELGATELRESMLNIVIVGGGATGVELAGAFAGFKNNIMPRDYPEYHRNDIRVWLIEGSPRLLGTMSEKTSRGALEYLEDKGVDVILETTVVDYRDGRVVLKDGRTIPTRNLIWTSGVTVKLPDGLDRFEKGRGGRLVTDMYFRLKGADNIFAVGDASIQTEDPANPNGYPQLARVAMEQASHLGRNLVRLSRGRMPEKFSYRQYPVLATVGRNHAFAEYKKFRMGGFVAWLSWAVIHLFLTLGVKNKLNIFMGWIWNYITYDLPTRVIIIPPGTDIYRADSVSVRGADASRQLQPAGKVDAGDAPVDAEIRRKGGKSPVAAGPDESGGTITGKVDRSQPGRLGRNGGGRKAAATARSATVKAGTEEEALSGTPGGKDANNKPVKAEAGNKKSRPGSVKKPTDIPVSNIDTGAGTIAGDTGKDTGSGGPEQSAVKHTGVSVTAGDAGIGQRQAEHSPAAQDSVAGTTAGNTNSGSGGVIRDLPSASREAGATAGNSLTADGDRSETPIPGTAATKEKVLA
ncbi:MAG: NAD(P)/FAD-dependent oxidoreductase [Rikenellaceae bacterium]|nr:NAD(P)/FAD-dependent oxidoreductase [Rikenellaceae bacterium]